MVNGYKKVIKVQLIMSKLIKVLLLKDKVHRNQLRKVGPNQNHLQIGNRRRKKAREGRDLDLGPIKKSLKRKKVNKKIKIKTKRIKKKRTSVIDHRDQDQRKRVKIKKK